MNRDTTFDRVTGADRPYDVIIVGGGATGLGAAVDAAARGHRTLVIEQADFAKGTSSRSTKLVHGGVRYLRQGNISLVLEALRERGLLYRNAPHLVRNMAFVIPSYKWWEGPFYGIGMKVYDQMAGRLGLEPSKILDKEETIERLPTIETEGLFGGVIYHDGQFDDARLAVNLAQTAADYRADVLNYVKCVGLVKEDGLVQGVELRDEESGREFVVRGRSVVNATGVFVDDLRRMDEPEAGAMVAPSQGVHIVLPKEFLPGNAAIMIPKTADGRVLFGVPWHGRVVFGTTDTPLKERNLEPRALAEEREFVMAHAAKYLAKDPAPEDVLSVFAGLRPLVKGGEGASTAGLSRDHTLVVSESGLITVTGGKWTTYRKMGEDIVDQAETVAGLDERACSTKRLRIHGWFEGEIKEEHLAVYGSDFSEIKRIIDLDESLGEPIHPRLPYQKAEVILHARREMARSVEDVLARRTRALLLDARAAAEAADPVASLMARELEKDAAWEKASAEAFREVAKGYDFLDPASTSSPKTS